MKAKISTLSILVAMVMVLGKVVQLAVSGHAG